MAHKINNGWQFLKYYMNNNIFTKLFSEIASSVKDHLGKNSSTRVNGYIVLFLICLLSFTSIAVEIGNAIALWNTDKGYTISYRFVIILSLLLGHHALIFNLKIKNEKTSYPSLENMNINEEDKTIEKGELKDNSPKG